MSLSVAIAGASGYAGGELLRILANHPNFTVKTVTAHSNVGETLHSQHPHLHSLPNLIFEETNSDTLSGHDILFLALPHGKSGDIIDAVEKSAHPPKFIVDCGADHRLTSESDWDDFYGGTFYESWTYGVPEMLYADGTKQREYLTTAQRIAAPGCNASLVSLCFAPAIQAGLIDEKSLNAVLAVGPSGAGKALRVNLLASEVMGSANPYAVGGVHRHIPEIHQNLKIAGAKDPQITFTPVIVPMARGILATCSAKMAPSVTLEQVEEAYARYDSEEFITVLPEGTFPRTADTTGSNSVLLGVTVDKVTGDLVVIGAVDNLMKGTAGAAIQSLNIACGLPENTGLTAIGVAP